MSDLSKFQSTRVPPTPRTKESPPDVAAMEMPMVPVKPSIDPPIGCKVSRFPVPRREVVDAPVSTADPDVAAGRDHRRRRDRSAGQVRLHQLAGIDAAFVDGIEGRVLGSHENQTIIEGA